RSVRVTVVPGTRAHRALARAGERADGLVEVCEIEHGAGRDRERAPCRQCVEPRRLQHAAIDRCGARIVAFGQYQRAGAGLGEPPSVAGRTAAAGLIGNRTPYELGLPGAGRERDRAAALQEEAGAEGRAIAAIARAGPGGHGIAVHGERTREGKATARLHEDGAAQAGAATTTAPEAAAAAEAACARALGAALADDVQNLSHN